MTQQDAAATQAEIARLREALGRVLAWQDALIDCSAAAKLTIRVQAAAEQPEPPDGAFPTADELQSLRWLLPGIAAVRMCNLFTKGHPEPGLVAANMSDDAKRLRDEVLAKAFPGQEERAAFDALLDRLTNARHQLIAHSDGAAMDVRFSGGPNYWAMWNGSTSGLHDVDLEGLVRMSDAIFDALTEVYGSVRALLRRLEGPTAERT
jgi:hypothetical protein